jgi:hypothetical protein
VTQLSTLAGRLLDIELGTADSTVLFTTERRNQGINDGIKEFAELTECFIREESSTLSTALLHPVTGSNGLITAGDFVRLAPHRPISFRHYSSAGGDVVVLAGKDDLPERTMRWLDNYRPGWLANDLTYSTTFQLPTDHFFDENGGVLSLGFTPRPSTAGSSAIFQVMVPYVALPPRIASTSATEEPFTVGGVTRTDLRPFHQAFVHFAAAQLEKLRKNTEASQSQLSAFLAYVQRFLASRRQKGGTMLTYGKDYFRRRETELDPRR